MPRPQKTIPIDAYALDVLMPDLVGHDRQPAAYLCYLHLYGRAARRRWQPVPASLRDLAEATGLSKSAVQTALETLRRRSSSRPPASTPPPCPSIGSRARGAGNRRIGNSLGQLRKFAQLSSHA